MIFIFVPIFCKKPKIGKLAVSGTNDFACPEKIQDQDVIVFKASEEQYFEMKKVPGTKEHLFIYQKDPSMCLSAVEIEKPKIETEETKLSPNDSFSAISKKANKGESLKTVALVLDVCDPDKPKENQSFFAYENSPSFQIKYDGLCLTKTEDMGRGEFLKCEKELETQLFEFIKYDSVDNPKPEAVNNPKPDSEKNNSSGKKDSEKESKPEENSEDKSKSNKKDTESKKESDKKSENAENKSNASENKESKLMGKEVDMDFRLKCLGLHMDL